MNTLLASLPPLLFTFTLFTAAMAQDPSPRASQDYDELARRIVSTSAVIKPGDVVVVAGGKHTIPLMEAVAVEAMKAGGMVQMFLDSDRIYRAFFAEIPEEHLEQEPRFFWEWFKHMDVWIGLPGLENEKAVFADVPEARFAKAAKAGQFFSELLNQAKIRGVFVGFPTREQATMNKLDFTTLERMHWAAVNADYQGISARGNELKRLLQGAKTVRVTTPAGTDFTFSIGDRPVFVDDGIVTTADMQSKLVFERTASLPGGQVFFTPIETSARGKVIVPKTQCRYEPLTGVSFEFKAGKMENFRAQQGADCFEQSMAPYTGPRDVLGFVSIGLNPELKVIEQEGDYRPENAAGIVWIRTGNNQIYGGNNKDPGGFGFPITNATVTVDGKVVVRNGQLAL